MELMLTEKERVRKMRRDMPCSQLGIGDRIFFIHSRSFSSQNSSTVTIPIVLINVLTMEPKTQVNCMKGKQLKRGKIDY